MQKQRGVYFSCILRLSLLLVLAGCNPAEKATEPANQEVDWKEYVSSNTSGLVSRESKIIVRFVNDVVTEERLAKPAQDIIEFMPKIDGTALFNTKRQIVFSPSEKLKSGQRYQAVLRTASLIGLPPEPGVYKFDFQVTKQDFEINMAGLLSSPADDTEMVLNGTLSTADWEDAKLIEKILTATYLNQDAPIAWEHSPDGKNHSFSISAIKRQERKAKVFLKWDGAPIGVVSQGRHDVVVPAADVFKVVNVRAVQEDRQYVRIEFSDNIDRQQDLRGLVQLSTPGYNIRAERNLIKIYSQDTLLGNVVVTINEGVTNIRGKKLRDRVEKTVHFSSQKPQVRFAGQGVILPENEILSIPFEAVNVKAVQVTAFRIYESNIAQFLQTNKLDGQHELRRVGRYLWRKTISLGTPEANKWNRYSLDATELVRENPGGLFRLALSINRGNSIYSCSDEANNVPIVKETPYVNYQDLHVKENSGWDFAENYYGNTSQVSWNDRHDPCNDAYYVHGKGVQAARNFLGSNIGIVAKKDSNGKLHLAATDIRTAEPMAQVELEIKNFQDRTIGLVSTDQEGFAEVELGEVPFYLVARTDSEIGYLKLNQGSALPISHFDVGGSRMKEGVKGSIYGERGVWRPGDDIYLTFVLQDKNDRIPADHPVTMHLYNPKGQLIQSVTNAKPVGDFYAFQHQTPEDGLTGNWTAKALVGGRVFTKSLKVETVIPNRLKVELDFGTEVLRKSEKPLQGNLFSEWLHGATASELKVDVAVRMRPVPTRFDRFRDFMFDDPVREFRGERQVIFEGNLDKTGHAEFEAELEHSLDIPGVLSAVFTSRVFEEGGAFSTSQSSFPYYPFENYVGIKVPKGDQTRGMLLTDTEHSVEIASVNSRGEPISLSNVQVTLYKVNWKWWWDNSGESLAQYSTASHSQMIHQGTISTFDGRGLWKFDIKYPQWGRYLIRACDQEGKHCTGKVIYVDWPGWAGRAQEEGGAGANVLSFFSDKPEYTVGETAIVQLPETAEGRALVSIENGSKVLQQRWLELTGERTSFDLRVTADMSPNVYVSVTLLQPHKDKQNDRPIRLYGSIPIRVQNPDTRLEPVLLAAEEWEPNTTVDVEVYEKAGKEMVYTLAVVDEGLLGLTGFKTPDLHGYFYRKEALGVSTWDVFDYVAGAYGGELERLLALGGDEDLLGDEDVTEDQKRFPPVVRFLGPFRLSSGERQRHAVDIPQYIGAVRLMLVAGEDAAYGKTAKSVFVREALSILPTLPRVLGPEEAFTVPVSVFAMKPEVRDVTLRVAATEQFEVVGNDTLTLSFEEPGEQLAFLNLRVREGMGKGTLRFLATSGQVQTESEIHIDIRSPNPRTLRQLQKEIAPGDEWFHEIVPHGIPNSNVVKLEVSAVRPLNLEHRLQYLIRYPHGCVEQVTSSVFPQLYLSHLVKLDEEQKAQIEKNINAAITRLRSFQNSAGAFMYWPGGNRNDWATNYAGHFLLEAEKAGYHVPSEMKSLWLGYQTEVAQSWITGTGRSVLDQAYRLYTLALANKPDLGAMNRLREGTALQSAARHQLAAAYSLAGSPDASADLLAQQELVISEYKTEGQTFGSQLRDKAIILSSLAAIGQRETAEPWADEISKALSADKWHSTQTVAYCLLAMAKITNVDAPNGTPPFEYRIGSGMMVKEELTSPVLITELSDFPEQGETIKVRNKGDRVLYVTVLSEGIPKPGAEVASSQGLAMDVTYTDVEGKPIDIVSLGQSADFVAEVQVRNTSERDLENVALAQIFPSGWEIRNTRFEGDDHQVDQAFDYQDYRDDRVYTYFGLKSGEVKRVNVFLNPAYLGRYYLPAASVEAMYDATKHARIKGQWVEVVPSKP